MKKIGLVVKVDPEAYRQAEEFESWLRNKKVEVVRRENSDEGERFLDRHVSEAPGDLSCIFVLGGDGTFLSAVGWIGDQPIPIIGVKFGEVGFLAETIEEKLFSAAESILDNKFTIEPRMRLAVTVVRGEKEVVRETVLNDMVINKGALARLAHIETRIDAHYLTTYHADGLILATPTGSTAYSLAAGGPIIHPAVPGIIMTPICPFTLTNRPLIVPDTVCISMRLAQEASDMMLTVDGQAGFALHDADLIEVRKSPHPVNLVTLPDHSYYEVLKKKLRWSGGRS